MDDTVPAKKEEWSNLWPELLAIPPSLNVSNSQTVASAEWPSSKGAPNQLIIPYDRYRHQMPSARSGTERISSHYTPQLSTSDSPSSFSFDVPAQSLPVQSDSELTSVVPLPSKPRVPRPPNAFMLYRSDFLRQRIIPSHIERRQENLSRIIGQCWQLLLPVEKEKWQDLAGKALVEHRKRTPDYKFTPVPRGSGRQKAKKRPVRVSDPGEGEDRIRQIREEYTQMSGPASTPARRKRTRTRPTYAPKETEQVQFQEQNEVQYTRKGEGNDEVFHQALQTPLPPSIPPSPCLPSPISASSDVPPLPPFFPQWSFPHVFAPLHPSTSLGFSITQDFHAAEQSSSLAGPGQTRPPSAASSDTSLSNFLQDLDITPTAATFGAIPMPNTPVAPAILPTSHFNYKIDFPEGLHERSPFAPLDLPSLEAPSPAALWSMLQQGKEPSKEGITGQMLQSTFTDDLFPYTQLPFDNQQFEDDLFSASMLDGWDLGSVLTETTQTFAS